MTIENQVRAIAGSFINLLREKPCHFRARMDRAGRRSRPCFL